MTPADYLRFVVLPTFAEFMAEPDDQRRAYLACITTAHLVDYVDVALGSPEGGKHKVRQAVRATDPYSAACLEIVEGVSNGTKHARKDPKVSQRFKFVPGYERRVPAFALDTPRAGLDEGRWDNPGLVVAHRIANGAEGLGSYFIDDCVCVVIRACATAFPGLLGSVDLGKVASKLDRAAWLSALMSIASGEVS